MIKINLAKKKSLTAATAGEDLRNKTKTFLNVLEKFKLAGPIEPGSPRSPITKLVSAVVIVIFAQGFVDDYREGEMNKLNKVFNKLSKDQKEAKAEVDKIKGFEAQKKQLEENEKILLAKLQVVQNLMSDRANSFKTLLALSKAIPSDAWMKSIKKKGKDITLQGGALEFNDVSDLMKKLSESTFFGVVQPKFQRNERTAGGVQFVNFELAVKK